MKKKDCSHIDNTVAQTKKTQKTITPDCALKLLKDGNQRFVEKLTYRRDLKAEVKVTSKGQYPFAIVLGCIDSRVPSELVFDQGIGDIFNTRIAGNFINDDILGGMEFALGEGVRLILVLGHTSCGAVKGAVAHCGEKDASAECSHIVPMVKNICPAVKSTKHKPGESDLDYANRVAKRNVKINMNNIRKQSKCLRVAEKKGKIKIVGGMYDVNTGAVDFFK